MPARLPPPALRLLAAALLGTGLASCGDEEAVALKSLSARGYSLSIAEYHRAAAAGDVPALEDFLRAGTGADVRDSRGDTALLAAARAGKASAVRCLVAGGASLDARSSEGHSALYLAAGEGHAEIVAAVLEAAAETQLKDPDTAGALEIAAARGHSAVVALLAARHVGSLDQALLAAATSGDVATLDILLQNGASPFARDAGGNTALHLAAKAGHGDAIQLLLASHSWRFTLNQQGLTALELATDHPEMARLLHSPPTDEENEFDSANPLAAKPQAAGELKEVPTAIPLTQEAAGLHLMKRLPALNGAIVDHRITSSGFPARVEERLQLRTVRPRQLPLVLESVTEDGASFRLLDAAPEVIQAKTGAPIGETGLVLEKAELQRPSDNSSLSDSWFPRAILRDTKTNDAFLALPHMPVRHGELTAVVTVPNTDEIFDARVDHAFRFLGEEDKEVRVTAISPHRITLRQGDKTWHLKP